MRVEKIFEENRTFKWIFLKSKSEKYKILFLTFGNIVYALSLTSFALLSKEILDAAISKNRDEIIHYGVLLFFVIFLQFILKIFLNLSSEYVINKLSMKYRREIFSKILEKKYKKISNYHSSELLNRMYSDVNIITSEIVSIFPEFVNLSVRLICAMSILISFNFNFLYIFLVLGSSIFIITRLLRKKLKTLHKEVQEKDGEARSFFQEILEKLLIIKIFSRNRYIVNESEKLQNAHLKSILKRRNISVTANSGFFLIFYLAYLATLIWGSLNISEGKMTYGTLLAMLQLVGQIQFPLANLSGFLPRIYKVVASAERVIALDELDNESIAVEKLEKNSFKYLEVKNLSFNYKEREVLNHVNFDINRGDMISLTGTSGGGKTTLFLLLLGIYTPTSGKIEISNYKKFFSPGLESREIFSYVPQGNQLFSGTIRENITLFKDDIPFEDIEKAAEIACAKEFIEKLPNKYDTVIGQNGFGLSEGQGQRIAIARSILTDAEFLLLDEATSALDEETEAKVLKNIENMNDKTCIIVTHRKAALKICNRHFYLIDNSIVENRS